MESFRSIELLRDAGQSRKGSASSPEDLIRAVRARYPSKAFCLVEDWILFRAQVSNEVLVRIHAEGNLPFFVYAFRVIVDSRGRFNPGDWVRSTMAIGFEEGVMVETKNTVYVLMGDGYEKEATLKTIFSFSFF